MSGQSETHKDPHPPEPQKGSGSDDKPPSYQAGYSHPHPHPHPSDKEKEANNSKVINHDFNDNDLTEEDPEEMASVPRAFVGMEVYASLVAAFSFLCTGLQRAYTSPAIASMKEDSSFFTPESPLTNTIVSWFASTPPLSSFIGTILSGVMLQFLGRQKTLVLLTLPLILGWLFIAFAQDTAMIMIGRTLTGLAAGFATASAPMYISECVRASVRGSLGLLPAMMLSLGILLGFSLSTLRLAWRPLALLMTIFPVALLGGSLLIPESPAWLLFRGRVQEAAASLRTLRGEKENTEEIQEMTRVLSRRKSVVSLKTAKEDPSFLDFLRAEFLSRREIRVPAAVTVSLMIYQQACGANAVIYYLSVILHEADPNLKNSSFDAALDDVPKGGLSVEAASVVFGLVQFVAFFVSVPLIDTLGRKVLLMLSAFFMLLPHMALGTFFWIKESPQSVIFGISNTSIIAWTFSWLPLACLSVFIAAYSIGFGPVPFIIMGEVFPSSARSYMVALASLVNHLALFLVVRLFPSLLDAVGPCVLFWLFGAACALAFVHVGVFVPETKGKTLAEIEMQFKKGGGDGGRRMSYKKRISSLF